MLARSLRRLGRDRRWRLRLAVTPDRAARGWPAAAMPQGRGDLGERMRRALAACPPGPAVLVGSDIPGLTAAHIADGVRAARPARCRVRAGDDGGFWLVGCRHRPPPLSARCAGRARTRSPTRSPICRARSRSGLPPRSTMSTTAPPTAGSRRCAGFEPYFSCSRGISSTKLQGRKRLSSWWTRMPSQASRQAPGEPGSANR